MPMILPSSFRCNGFNPLYRFFHLPKCKNRCQFSSWANADQWTFDQVKRHRGCLRRYFQTESDPQKQHLTIISLFQKVFRKTASLKDSEQLIDLLSGFMSKTCWKEFFEQTTPQERLRVLQIQERYSGAEIIKKSSLKQYLKNSVSKLVDILLSINLILRDVFTIFKANKTYQSFWEKYLLLEMTSKLLLFPAAVLFVLKPFLKNSLYVHLIVGGIFSVIVLLLGNFHRFYKIPPRNIVNCKNLEIDCDRYSQDKKIGQMKELSDLRSILLSHSNALILGKSGAGKTTLIQNWIQHKNKKEMNQELKKKRVFELNCGDIISNGTFGYEEMIRQTRTQFKGVEDQICLVIDEVGQLLNHVSAFQSIKKNFLDDSKLRVIMIMTLDEFEKLKNLDVDGSIRRRFHTIAMQPLSENEQKTLIYQSVRKYLRDLPIHSNGSEAFLNAAKDPDFMPKIDFIAKAVHLVKAVGAISRAELERKSSSVEWMEKENQLRMIELKVLTHSFEASDLVALDRLNEEISAIKKEQERENRKIERVKELIILRDALEEVYQKKTINSIENPFLNLDKVKIKHYLCFLYLLPFLNQKIGKKLHKIKAYRKIEINQEFIQTHFKSIKQLVNDHGKEG